MRLRRNHLALAAIALCCDAAVLTACSNDFSYNEVFGRQIEALGSVGDVAFGISTSGKSPNVIRASRTAKNLGLSTILLTGADAGNAIALADIVVAVPAANTARIQELHLASYHIICELIEDHVFGELE